MQILYVDDDSDDRELFAEALRQIDRSISVTTFSAGKELLEYLSNVEKIPHYIFIDINMPMITGYECATRIREMKKLDDTNIVMFSTAFSPADIKKFTENNYKFLVKPGDFMEMIQSIRKLIEPG